MQELNPSGSDDQLNLEGGVVYSSSMSSDSHCTSFSRLSYDFPSSTSPEKKNVTTETETETATTTLKLKPHRSSDSTFQLIRSTKRLTFRDFSLVRQIGTGDISRVYLCRLRDREETSEKGEEMKVYYAMKVVDEEVVALKKKTKRAETERKIMKMIDHPFLPTLYAEFEASHFSCIVMEYCSGGDLLSLRHKQPHNRFSITSTRFYAGEVLVALEYLHMLGIIYRDLKPENVLVRSDGHIVLTDFDLSLAADVIPAVESPDFTSDHSICPSSAKSTTPRAPSPFACIVNWLFRSKKIQTLSTNRLFVAEPVTAWSCSFVGTHEYVAPEVASGKSHGNAVDWWAFGIFVYEMLYGRTPFAGVSNEATLRNIVKQPLSFPTDSPNSVSEYHARNLISGLLVKDPGMRLGSKRGAADIKVHPFFKGLNFALIRSLTPPVIPGMRIKQKTTTARHEKKEPSAPFDFF